MKRLGKALLAAAAALAISACAYDGERVPGDITTEVGLSVTPDGKGGFEFRYDGEYADERGNLNLAEGEAAHNSVFIVISIADGAPPGLRFKPEGRDAMWIVEKERVGEDGSPTGPYRGEQFGDFTVDADGKRLSVYDRNNDGVLYRYGLRFDFEGATVVDDPDTQNGTGGKR